MRLLVSVTDADEAEAALAGGADLIDAKDSLAGPLGAVTIDVLRDIWVRVGEERPVTAALGDALDEGDIEALAFRFASAGAELVKVGFSGIGSVDRILALTAAAVRGTRASGQKKAGVVAVAYADAPPTAAPALAVLAHAAAHAGAVGVLLDTADKSGPGLCALVDPHALAAWVAESQRDGLLVALAGKLATDDLPLLLDTGADIVGVRGAACVGGRTGRVSIDRVRRLGERLRGSPALG